MSGTLNQKQLPKVMVGNKLVTPHLIFDSDAILRRKNYDDIYRLFAGLSNVDPKSMLLKRFECGFDWRWPRVVL